MLVRHARHSSLPFGRHRDEGFSLVEMLVALVVIAVVVASSTAVLIRAHIAFDSESTSDRATQVAVAELEQIRALDFHDIGFYSDTFSAALQNNPPSGLPTYASAYPNINNAGAGASSQKLYENTFDGLLGVMLTGNDPHTNPADGYADSVSNQILPYREVKTSTDDFYVYTTITWGIDTALGLPAQSQTTDSPTTNPKSADLYDYKEVNVNVYWYDRGHALQHVQNQTTYDPTQYEEAPPGINVNQETSSSAPFPGDNTTPAPHTGANACITPTTSVTGNTVTVSWNPASGATSYITEYFNAAGTPVTGANSTTNTSTQYTSDGTIKVAVIAVGSSYATVTQPSTCANTTVTLP